MRCASCRRSRGFFLLSPLHCRTTGRRLPPPLFFLHIERIHSRSSVQTPAFSLFKLHRFLPPVLHPHPYIRRHFRYSPSPEARARSVTFKYPVFWTILFCPCLKHVSRQGRFPPVQPPQHHKKPIRSKEFHQDGYILLIRVCCFYLFQPLVAYFLFSLVDLSIFLSRTTFFLAFATFSGRFFISLKCCSFL